MGETQPERKLSQSEAADRSSEPPPAHPVTPPETHVPGRQTPRRRPPRPPAAPAPPASQPPPPPPPATQPPPPAPPAEQPEPPPASASPASQAAPAAPPATDRPSGAVRPADTGSTAAPTVGGTAQARGDHDGLAAQVAEVEAARARLGHGLEHLEREVRAQIGYSVERILWKIAAAGAAIAAGIAVRKGLTVGWRALRKSEPPENLASRSTGWGEALAWTAATGVGMAVAKLVAARGAAAGWEKATGSPPPEA